jgi:hypothetical protein
VVAVLAIIGVAVAVFAFGGPNGAPLLAGASTEPSPSTAESSVSAPPTGGASAGAGISQADAVEIARAAVPEIGSQDVQVAMVGTPSEVLEDLVALDWAKAIPADARVWYLYFADHEAKSASIVVLGEADGTIYGEMVGGSIFRPGDE